MDNLVFASLVEIKFRRHNHQFVGYALEAEQWMKQWTAKNNFKVLVLPGAEVKVALQTWAEQHLDTVRQHFGYLIPEEFRALYNYGRDFSFTYSFVPFEIGKEFWSVNNPQEIVLSDIDTYDL